MANRVLTRANDAVQEILEDGEPHNVGMWEEVTIERSAAGQPGILVVVTRYENDREYDQMCVTIPDGRAFLAPVNEWLGTPRRTVRPYGGNQAPAPAESALTLRDRDAWRILQVAIESAAVDLAKIKARWEARGDYEVAPEPIENPCTNPENRKTGAVPNGSTT